MSLCYPDMGFFGSNALKDDAEVNQKQSDKSNIPIPTMVTIENPKDCCKSCQRNKYFFVLQGLFNIALIILIIILFIMVNNLKSNIDDSLLPHKRTKRLHNDPILRKEYSVGDEDVNTTNPKTMSTTTSTTTTTTTTKSSTNEPRFLTKLEVLDTEVEPKLVRQY